MDGGACKVGVESTVIDGLCLPPMLLRPGGFTYEQIVELGGNEWSNCKVENKKGLAEGEKVRTPGMKYKHYSPSAKVVLMIPETKFSKEKYFKKISQIIEEECSLGTINKISILTTVNLSSMISELPSISNDISLAQKPLIFAKSLGRIGEEIQTNLFALLREVDEADQVDLILVEGIPENCEGLAVMNRLKKAAGYNHVPI